MSTHRLYYQDATLRMFTAGVVGKKQTERGPAVELDQTAFYPTSGGQPYDTGTLNGVRVLDVWEDDEGAIWHLLERPLDAGRVSGEIEWGRRFDHMQQHTGQHMLSAAFLEILEAPTTSFHLGSESSTIDLEIPDLSWEAAFQVEESVNRVIWENRPVKVTIVERDELAGIPLRKPPQVQGKIRVVWVDGYDASACGGTHVTQTGEIGLIKIVSLARYKGGVRVGFLCGGRALGDYRRVLRSLQETSADLSVHQDELRDAVSRLEAEVRQSRRDLKRALGELLAHEAEQLWRETREVDGLRLVSACWAERSFEEVRQLAMRLGERPRTVALLAAGDGQSLRLSCARSDDLGSRHAGDLLRAAAEALGGRGGGTASVAQGGAPAQPCDRVLEVFRQVLR